MITDRAGVDQLLTTLQPCNRVAVDTEANSLHSYFERLCLVQISIPQQSYLLDPLSGIDLQILLDQLQDKEVIFHGSDYDLRLLNREGSFKPKALFDTMLGAKLAGEKQIGLAALVEKYFDVKLSKASQKANWALRPLPNEMLEYAINDTHYLLSLAEIIEKNLRNQSRLEWLAETTQRMIANALIKTEKDLETRWRITGTSILPQRAQAIVKQLWLWRDAEARAWDKPPFYVMSNQDILRIAESAAADRPFTTPPFSKTRRERFEQALTHALQIPQEQWPIFVRERRPKPPKEQIARFEALKKIRDQCAQQLDLEPSIIAPKAALEAAAEDPESPLLMKWQRNLLGL